MVDGDTGDRDASLDLIQPQLVLLLTSLKGLRTLGEVASRCGDHAVEVANRVLDALDLRVSLGLLECSPLLELVQLEGLSFQKFGGSATLVSHRFPFGSWEYRLPREVGNTFLAAFLKLSQVLEI